MAEEAVVADGLWAKLLMYRRKPWTQVLVISVVCFCCPGMFNALGGMGAGGNVNPVAASNASTAISSMVAVFSIFVCGPMLSMFGPQLMLLIGGWTYALYAGSLMKYSDGGFVVGSGVLLGIGAAFLWVAQGAITTSYVPENYKGRSTALFWFIFNIGGTIGSLIAFGLNYKSASNKVSNATYITFIVIMVFGWLLSVMLCSPKDLDEKDLKLILALDDKGLNTKANWSKDRLIRSFSRLFKEFIKWKSLSLIPIFFSANIFYPYQQSIVNFYTFDIRTRALNSALYWLAQMFGALVMGGILDMLPTNRRNRGIIGWTFLSVMTLGIWGGGYQFEKWLEARNEMGLLQTVDFQDGSTYLGPMFLYMFYGAYDSFFQLFCYWIIGAISNSVYVSAVLVGSYKAFLGAGGAMASRVNAVGAGQTTVSGLNGTWMTQFALNWGLLQGSLLIALPCVLAVTMTNKLEVSEVEEQLNEVGETLANIDGLDDIIAEKQAQVEVTEEV